MSRLAGFSFGAVYSNRYEQQVSPRGAVFGLVLNVLPLSNTRWIFVDASLSRGPYQSLDFSQTCPLYEFGQTNYVVLRTEGLARLVKRPK